MCKIFSDQEDNAPDSAKNLHYNPVSVHIKKRDSQYCKVVEKKQPVPIIKHSSHSSSLLKSLRISFDEEDEEKFIGFRKDEVMENGDKVRRLLPLLNPNFQQELLDQYIEAEPASVAAGSSKLDTSTPSGIPEPAPHEIILDDFPSDEEDVPADCEFRRCKSSLRIEFYELGQDHMVVTRENHDHKHN